MPIYNKITLNGTTLIDLSTDTVAVADDIASGKVGHLNTGATATGTHSGGSAVEITRYSPDAVSFMYFLKSDIDKLKEYPLIVSFNDYNNKKYSLLFYEGNPNGSTFSYLLSMGLSNGSSSQRLNYTRSSDSFTFQGGTYTYDSTNDYYYAESDN